MSKKRTVVPFYGKNVQYHEQMASRYAKGGNFEAATAEREMARLAYNKNRQRAGRS